mmetsp:Transcript_11352/g.19177  ORF Transcript_11352/g.19177 Transcript_11352/m.19177 type:complete len:184 (-) Transcript_11352:78-629(-)
MMSEAWLRVYTATHYLVLIGQRAVGHMVADSWNQCGLLGAQGVYFKKEHLCSSCIQLACLEHAEHTARTWERRVSSRCVDSTSATEVQLQHVEMFLIGNITLPTTAVRSASWTNTIAATIWGCFETPHQVVHKRLRVAHMKVWPWSGAAARHWWPFVQRVLIKKLKRLKASHMATCRARPTSE